MVQSSFVKFLVKVLSIGLFFEFRNVDFVVRCWIEEFEVFVVEWLKEVSVFLFDMQVVVFF